MPTSGVPLPTRISVCLPGALQFVQVSHLCSSLSMIPETPRRGDTVLRMGGGPRTYPGGVSKWQWKRMQAKKAKQLLRARLARERQIYEMRKRAELRAAVSELERPWEPVSSAPILFSVSADEQLKVLADRFQKPGGIDLWTENDGPQLFATPDGIPSARFFPKGVVYSVRPYGKISNVSSEDSDSGGEESNRDEQEWRKRRSTARLDGNSSNKTSDPRPRVSPKENTRHMRKNLLRRGNKPMDLRGSKDALPGEVYDMNLADDESYGFQT